MNLALTNRLNRCAKNTQLRQAKAVCRLTQRLGRIKLSRQ